MLSTNGNYEFYRSEHEQRKSIRRTRKWTHPCLESLGILPGAKILSVGCGSGTDVLTLRSLGYDAWGTDISPCLPEADPYFVLANGSGLPFADSSFDAVLALEVIEHVGASQSPEREKFCNELRRISRNAIVIATPNRLFPIDEHGDPLRFHSPFNDGTVSYSELCSYFRAMEPHVLPWGKYFAFERFSRYITPAGTALANAAFQLLTPRIVHASPLNPHLFVAFISGNPQLCPTQQS